MALGLTPKQIIEKNKYPLLNICNDWERVLLGNIIEIQNGYAFSSIYFTREEGVPLIRIRDIADEQTENYFIGEYSDDFVVQKGDFLIGMDGDFKLSKWPGERGLLNQRVCRLRNESKLYNKQFLFFVLQPYLNAIHSETSSVTVKHLSSRTIADIPIPLPSLPEQRAIVKKLESLFSSLDAGVADLKKAQQQLKIYRQAVLKKAFEGELTNQVLTNDLPDGWKWVRLKDISELITDGDHQAPPKSEKGIPFITISNVNKVTNKINFDNTFKVGNEYYYNLKEHRKPRLGDVLYTVTGSFGIPIIIDFEKEFCFQRHIGLIRPLSSVNQKYLYYLLQTNAVFNQASETATGTAQKTVALSSLRNFNIPFCSDIVEQKEIVKQIESRLSVCDSIEQNIKESLEKAEALRQSILKKAFEGNLLTAQELAECKLVKDYESASVLLERIKAEKTEIKAKPSKKKVAQPLVVAKTETPVAKISADIHAGLIAKVIKIHEENPASIDNLSHIKCEKIAHLVEYHLQIPLGRQPVKDAAGPDDYPHLKKVEHRAKMANYFAIQKKEIGYSYSSAKNSDKAIDKFQSALSDEKNKQLDDLIALFLKFDLEVSEIIATTYAGWNNLILSGNVNPPDEEIVYESRENWSERKLKIARERFFKAIEWLRKNEIVPLGYGAVVPFPKKKK